jgi:hypothetical protein
MLPRAESISNRYPELTMITGGAETASRDMLMLVFWAASVGASSPVRIPAPLKGKQEAIAVEATSERNRLRENRLEPGTITLSYCKHTILLADAQQCQDNYALLCQDRNPRQKASLSAIGVNRGLAALLNKLDFEAIAGPKNNCHTKDMPAQRITSPFATPERSADVLGVSRKRASELIKLARSFASAGSTVTSRRSPKHEEAHIKKTAK